MDKYDNSLRADNVNVNIVVRIRRKYVEKYGSNKYGMVVGSAF